MRLNVEERAFGDSRIKKLAYLSGIDEAHLIGPLPRLWHGSQSEGKVEATREEILDWCLVFEEEAGDRLFKALLKSKYVSQVGDDLYRIKGNEVQIESARKHLEKSKRGGTSSSRKIKLLEEKANNRSSSARAQVEHCSTNTMQEQGNADQGIKEKIEKKKESSESEVDSFSLSDANASAVSLEKGKIPKKWEGKISDFDCSTAKTWLTYAREKMPNAKFKESDFQVAITRMRHEYRLSESDITSLFSWCQNSDFWQDKSVSPARLLRRKGEKTNLDLILLQKAQQNRNLSLVNSNRPKLDDGHIEYKRRIIREVAEQQAEMEAQQEAGWPNES